MSHSGTHFANLVNGWTVSARSPDVEDLRVTTTPAGDPAQAGGARLDIALDIDFSSQEPVVIRFDGMAATNQIYAFLDLSILNHSNKNWNAFNISAIDQQSVPVAGDYNAAHPFFSHFHDVGEDTFSNFSTRNAWNSVLGTNEPNNAGNSWEFSNGTYLRNSVAPLSFQNFRTHQYNFDAATGNGGTFYVILTPNRERVDYSGYQIGEDSTNIDFIEGDNGNTTPRKDMLFGYQGNDLIYGHELDDLIYGGDGNDRLYGGKGTDTLRGGLGADLLEGGQSGDTMFGGEGNDTYLIDSASDFVLELAGEGVDIFKSSVSCTLRANVENLNLVGNANIRGIGNPLDNRINGNSGNNVIEGAQGNDKLKGFGGNDAFLFDSALRPGNVDRVLSFSPADDVIRLDNVVFTGLPVGGLAGAKFKDIASGPVDPSDRILYNSDSGAVYFDANGSGPGARKLFAVIENDPVLTAADFFVV